jgi:hypothetical protein
MVSSPRRRLELVGHRGPGRDIGQIGQQSFNAKLITLM